MASLSTTTDCSGPDTCEVEGCNAPLRPATKHCRCGNMKHYHVDIRRPKDVNLLPHIAGACCKCAEKAAAPHTKLHQLWMQQIITDCRPEHELSPPHGWPIFKELLRGGPEFYKSWAAARIRARSADEWTFKDACMQILIQHELEEHKQFIKMMDGAANPKPAAPPARPRPPRLVSLCAGFLGR